MRGSVPETESPEGDFGQVGAAALQDYPDRMNTQDVACLSAAAGTGPEVSAEGPADALPGVPAQALLTASPASACAGVVTGILRGFADDGRTPLVTLSAPDDVVALRARSAVDLHGAHVGREVVIALDGGDRNKPIVLALLRGADPMPSGEAPASSTDRWQLRVDGERCILSARHELVLECGKARLILRADGRAELRGETILTEATHANKVRGGSVQLN